jgi:demethylmenaquinone methyltransferase/2-methoxy-6-polyprenyl-1,4-benzoquinol methylase
LAIIDDTVHAPDPDLAIERYRRHAPGYDASAQRTMRLRARTIALLALRPGDRVLDVGCGTGLSLPMLRAGVGAAGRVIGVEVSPDMLRLARERAAREGWRNVDLIECTLERAAIPGPLDAILFNYTHDVLRSAAALANIFGQARPGAWVAVAGMKYVSRWLWPVNAFVRHKARPYATTLEGLERPWSLLEPYLAGFETRPTMLGTGYLGRGIVRGADEQS